jgi:hypothetical protein
MRCICCSVMLTPFESTMRTVNTNKYVDMCEKCYSYVESDLPVFVREDLRTEVGMDIAISKDDVNDINNDYIR